MNVEPVLRRFEITVLKDKGTGPNPTDQVPAAGALVSFYRQGATLAEEAELVAGESKEAAVFNRGALVPGDTVQVGTTPGATISVGTHPIQLQGELPRLTLTYNGPGVIIIEEYSRLVPTNDRPDALIDPTGATATGNPSITTQANGRASCYIAPFRFDYIVTIGLLARLYVEAESSYVMRT